MSKNLGLFSQCKVFIKLKGKVKNNTFNGSIFLNLPKNLSMYYINIYIHIYNPQYIYNPKFYSLYISDR